MSNYAVIKKTETPTSLIELCDDGIVRVVGKKNTVLDEEQMKINIAVYNELIEGKRYAFLYSAEDESFIFNNDAIRYAKSNQNSFPKVCIGVAVKSLAHRIVANFYLKFSAQLSPMKIFNSIAEAEQWCLELYARDQQRFKDPGKTILF